MAIAGQWGNRSLKAKRINAEKREQQERPKAIVWTHEMTAPFSCARIKGATKNSSDRWSAAKGALYHLPNDDGAAERISGAALPCELELAACGGQTMR